MNVRSTRAAPTLAQCEELFKTAAIATTDEFPPQNIKSSSLNQSSSLQPFIPATNTRLTENNATTMNRQERFCSSQVLGEKQVWSNHKKVISYSIFGPTKNNKNNDVQNATTAIPNWVLHGMERNIMDAQRFYPDWIVRIHAFDLPQMIQDKWLNASVFHNVELVECYSNTLLAKSSARKMMARLLAYDDPNVLYTSIRDADSRLSLREVMAVNEFIAASMATDNVMKRPPRDGIDSNDNQVDRSWEEHATEQPQTDSNHHHQHDKDAIYFHVMRDHAAHTVPIMGCSLGMKRGLFQASVQLETGISSMSQLLNKALQEHPDNLGGCCGEDQEFLASYLWPHVRKVALDHDMMPHRCRGFGSKLCREFPLGPRDQSIDYFVGSPFKEQDAQKQWHTKYQRHTCTLQCNLTNE